MRQYPKTFNNNWPCTGLIKAALPIPFRRLGIVITQNQRFFTIQTPAQTCHFRFISKSEIPKNEHPVLPGYSFIPVLNDQFRFYRPSLWPLEPVWVSGVLLTLWKVMAMIILARMLMCDKVTHKNLISRPTTIPNFIMQKKQNRHNRLLCFFYIPY